jgi:hypothetical protein
VKGISARAALISVFLGLAAVGQAEDYYIYHNPEGKLVISNKKPPPESKIIKQLPRVPDSETPQSVQPKTQPNGHMEGSPKPCKNGQS